MDRKEAFRWLRVSLVVLLILAGLAAVVANHLWQDRAEISEIRLPHAGITTAREVEVTATWLGISTLLFDDGDTQILIDGTFTRISPLHVAFFLPVSSDIAAINYALTTFRMNRLAAIVPIHSHFDHAMDIGHIANRTTAVVLGSESTANIARGANVPVGQYQTLASEETRQFGKFTIRLVSSKHAPIGLGGQEWYPGTIELPLRQPARTSTWKTGEAWSIFIEHPRGTALIQGSGGFIEGRLRDEHADVVMLGIAGLASLGKEYTQTYWNESVTTTGTDRVIVVHHDDYTAPFGEVRLFPRIADDALQTTKWIDEINKAGDNPIIVELPPFGQPIPLY